MALPNTPPCSAGFILSCGEGHEGSEVKQIWICANEPKPCREPAERLSPLRTEVEGIIDNTVSTLNCKIQCLSCWVSV